MSHTTVAVPHRLSPKARRAAETGLFLGLIGALVLAPELAFAAGPFSNPAPVAPPGAQGTADKVMGWVKWGALGVIIGAGFVGAGAVAGGHVFSHQRSSQVGLKILTGALMGAVVYAIIYGIITALTQ